MNGLNTNQFVEILNHLFKTGNSDPQTGLDVQLTQELKESLQISDEKLELLIQSLIHIYKQSMKIIVKPTTLENQLIEQLKFDNIKAQEFIKVWSENTKLDFGNFEKNVQLNDVLWELNLETPANKPHVSMQLNVTDKTNKSEEILMDLNKQELMELYATLETVQNRLDHVQNANN